MTISPDVDRLGRARAGDEGAIGELYAAYLEPARSFARSICASTADADDLVSAAFERVLGLLRRGEGPTGNFRAYLFTSIRNAHIDLMRRRRDIPVSDRPWMLDVPIEGVSAIDQHFDDEVAAAAMRSLPSAWQRVLWHVEVEGRSAAEIGELLGMQPGAVSASAYRAREGLKLAYLDQYRAAAPQLQGCEWTRPRLAKLVRNRLSPRAAAKAELHLDECLACVVVVEQMREKNQRLSALYVPVIVVAGAATFGPGGASVPASGNERASEADATRARRLRTFASRHRAAASACAAAIVTLVAVGAWAVASGGSTAEPGPDEVQPSPSASRAPTETDPPGSPLPPPATEGPPHIRPTTLAFAPRSVAHAVAPLSVRLVAATIPTATPAATCGTYGSVELPSTPGVSYVLSQGDGRSGPWSVTASAEPGFQLDPATPSIFSGDLGPYAPCSSIASVTRTAAGNGGWDISTDISASGPLTDRISIDVRIDTLAFVSTVAGTGWTCWATDGATRQELDGQGQYQLQPGAQWVTCEHAAADTDPVPVVVMLDAAAADPTGSVTASQAGAVIDTATY